MFCLHCNSEIPDGSIFCPYCGKKVEVTTYKIDNTSIYQVDDRIYGTCNKVERGTCYFGVEGEKNAVFYMSSKWLEDNGIPAERGSTLWGIVKDLENKDDKFRLKVQVVKPNDNKQLYEDFQWFYQRHSVGDVIFAPVTKATDSYIEINITSNVKNRVSKNMFSDSLLFDDFKVGNIEKFEIKELKKKDEGKHEIILSPCSRYVNKNVLWDEIPENLQGTDVIISKNIFEYLDNGVLEFLIGNRITNNPQDLKESISRIYSEQYNEKKVYVERRGKALNINFALGYRNENGVPEEVYMKREPKDKWVISTIMPTRAERFMERYVLIPDINGMIDELADLCLTGEAWDYGNSNSGQKKILRNYLYFAFYKSWLDELFEENDYGYIFNTGLVDNAYDDIYCYFEPNLESDFYHRKWRFAYFACRGKDSRGKELNRLFPSFPKAPSYIDNEHISDLYFNTDKELICDYDHIIGDNVERLPYEFLRTRLNYDTKVNPLILEYEKETNDNKRREILKKLYDIIREDNPDGERLRRELQEGLKSAVETSKKYCKWNYKTAIPVYYAKTNSISLLLPLKLRQNKNVHADIALVVERLQNGNYQGQTIFTLEMAYQDARQICRPNSDWLLPQDIH